MPLPKREGQWKTINLQISADLYDQLKERVDIQGADHDDDAGADSCNVLQGASEQGAER